MAKEWKLYCLKLGECRAAIMLPYPMPAHPLPQLHLPLSMEQGSIGPSQRYFASPVLIMGGINTSEVLAFRKTTKMTTANKQLSERYALEALAQTDVLSITVSL